MSTVEGSTAAEGGVSKRRSPSRLLRREDEIQVRPSGWQQLALRTLARVFPVGDVCEGQLRVVEGKVHAEAISNFWWWG